MTKKTRKKRQRNRFLQGGIFLLITVVLLTQLFSSDKKLISPTAMQANQMSTHFNDDSSSPATYEKFGEGASAYWIYYPPTATPKPSPVVLFLHGWLAIDPYFYGGWIDHLTQQGTIVIYPAYQTSRKESAQEMLEYALIGTKEAISTLENHPEVTPNLDHFTIIGHSLGGGLSVKIASRLNIAKDTIPKAIMAVQPGWLGEEQMPTEQLNNLSGSLKLLIVEGDADQFSSSRQIRVKLEKCRSLKGARSRRRVKLGNFPTLL